MQTPAEAHETALRVPVVPPGAPLWTDNGAGAEEERVVFLPLVLLGVDVKRLALHHRRFLDGLPGRAEDAAQEHVDVVFPDELGGGGGRLRVVGCAVLDEQFEATAEQAAACIGFVHDQCRDVGLSAPHDGKGARLVGRSRRF